MNNLLIPKHKIISKEELNQILQKYNIENSSKLPKIKLDDPVLKEMEVEIGDVVEISREDFFESSKYFREVVK